MCEEIKESKRKVDKSSVYWNLQSVDVSKKLDTKQNMKYLSWSWAWAEVKKLYPEAKYVIYENKKKDQLPIWGNPEMGYFCKVAVEIEGIIHESRLPVMNASMKAMKNRGYSYKAFDKYNKKYVNKQVDAITVMEINKTVQRALVKACAMHGLGLNVWKGEDLPEVILETINSKKEKEIVEDISVIEEVSELKDYFNELKEDYFITSDVVKLYEQREAQINEANL